MVLKILKNIKNLALIKDVSEELTNYIKNECNLTKIKTNFKNIPEIEKKLLAAFIVNSLFIIGILFFLPSIGDSIIFTLIQFLQIIILLLLNMYRKKNLRSSKG